MRKDQSQHGIVGKGDHGLLKVVFKRHFLGEVRNCNQLKGLGGNNNKGSTFVFCKRRKWNSVSTMELTCAL